MRTTRIHVDQSLKSGRRLALPEDAAGHLVRVLRLQAGDTCVLFNGDGRGYPATLPVRRAPVNPTTSKVTGSSCTP